jgi:hypothetical protein
MKTNEQKLYGPEVPGYAQLNEALRRPTSAEKPKPRKSKGKGTSQPNEKAP